MQKLHCIKIYIHTFQYLFLLPVEFHARACMNGINLAWEIQREINCKSLLLSWTAEICRNKSTLCLEAEIQMQKSVEEIHLPQPHAHGRLLLLIWMHFRTPYLPVFSPPEYSSRMLDYSEEVQLHLHTYLLIQTKGIVEPTIPCIIIHQ
jgi:hypothetical protein